MRTVEYFHLKLRGVSSPHLWRAWTTGKKIHHPEKSARITILSFDANIAEQRKAKTTAKNEAKTNNN